MIKNLLAASSRRLQAIHFGAVHARTSVRTPWVVVPRHSAAAVATTTAMVLWYLSSNPVHNDTAQTISSGSPRSSRVDTSSTGVDENGVLRPVVWGSNRSNLLDPYSPEVETFRTPVNVKWLENMALRDLVLHERHAALVDVRGDVYQWGDGFFGSKSDAMGPKATLRGKNIIKVQLTDSLVYALSASGRIYVFAADEERQKFPATQSSSTVFSWAAGWTSREHGSIDFVEIFPKEKLKWSETFVSIAAGNDHLLALTSDGRTYAHPMNKNANSHGQLGLRKVEIPASPDPKDVLNHSHVTVELVPRSLVKPYANASLTFQELPQTNALSEDLNAVDDNHIVFSDALFEIPSLRGIKVAQIAAGGRSSFVNTSSGRVLGWGANEHGQIGLGSGVTLDTITVPTEIDVTRNTPISTKSKCLSVTAGGDLTYFVVERNAREPPAYVDILSCGNGQWGGLGNNTFSTFQGSPVRMKNTSGLREFDEREQKISPIIPHTISVSPTGHVLLSLDTQSRAGPGGLGRDLVAWGLNHDYQLGTGKRSSLNAPMVLERPEGGRFILARRKAAVRDLSGKVWKNNVEVEQCAISGYGNSVVYWKTRCP